MSRASQVAARVVVLTGVWTALCGPACGQGTKEDYEKAKAFSQWTRGKVLTDRVEPYWLEGGTRFWYRSQVSEKGHELLLVDAAKVIRSRAFDHERLAQALSEVTGKSHEPTRLAIDALDVPEAGSPIRFNIGDKGYLWEASEAKLVEAAALPKQAPARNDGPPRFGRGTRESQRSRRSPDGRWVVSIRDHNLVLRSDRSDEEFLLSHDGKADDAYSADVFWSPDSRKLVAFRTKKGDERKVYLIESSPKGQLQPKLHSYNYLKPGDRVPVPRPCLFDVVERVPVPVADDLFANPYELNGVRWVPDSSRFTFVYNERGHQVLRVIAVDAATGSARALIDERSSTFVDYSQKQFLRYFDETNELLWMSERSGWNHLYLVDSRTGELKTPVTRGEWVVRAVTRVDEKARQVWFQAGGYHSGQDPYYLHHFRVNFDGTGLVALTEGDGTHSVRFSPDGKYLIDTYSRVDMPPVVELRRVEDGGLVLTLEKGDASQLVALGWQVPERFAAKGRDGTTDIYGVIYRPTTFDPKCSYPVIESIYAGPHGAFVPKAFGPSHYAQAMAELGFIVVQIDGMGTNWRSRAFHDVCWRNLADAGFPDRILWLKAAAAKYPYIDVSRVGIYGGSAGGQNALAALLFHGDFYKVAVADCGCHDNRMDKIWWNEAWMGWPVGPHYAANSNVENAHKLQGKLLLTVGELDHNVDPASTMQVVNALIKADKDFELIVFPGADHGGGGAYGQRRRQDFFVRHLLGVEPRNAGSRQTVTGGSPVIPIVP